VVPVTVQALIELLTNEADPDSHVVVGSWWITGANHVGDKITVLSTSSTPPAEYRPD
jgi:hypothetical protein